MSIVHIHPKYQDLKAELLGCIDHFETEGDAITAGDRNSIKSFTLSRETVNIKSFKAPKLINSMVYKYFRKSKAKRSFEYAEKLIACGIRTPLPIAYIENFSATGLKSSYYISRHIAYDFDFRTLIHQPLFDNRDAILRQFTQFTFQLHENNINFLDHSPGNTLIIENGDHYEFYLIDLNRMRFEPLDLKARMENLKRLWLSKKMIRIIAEEYAVLSKEPFEEVYKNLLASSKAFKLKINRKKRLKRKYLKRKKPQVAV